MSGFCKVEMSGSIDFNISNWDLVIMGVPALMSMNEAYKHEVILKVIERRLKQTDAAIRLGITERQVRRLIKRFKEFGPAGLISRKRGKPSNRRLPSHIESHCLTLIRAKYSDFGPTLACEKLNEVHGFSLSVETVRKLMVKAELWITRDKKKKRSYQPRYRRECYGELIQIDGSNHDWFEGRLPKCTLLVAIDDATSALMGIKFVPTESTFSYLGFIKEYKLQHGKPVSFYSDKLSVFRVNHKSQAKDKKITQFCRALNDINVDLICANSCQAKGKVERANKTLQDRLVKELRLEDISDIDEANKFLETFMLDHNKRFSKPPLIAHDAHRPLLPHEDLEKIFCWKEQRTVTVNLTIQYNKRLYLIEDTEQNRALRRQKISVLDFEDKPIELYDGDRPLAYRVLYDRVTTDDPRVESGKIVENKHLSHVLSFIKFTQERYELSRSQKAPRKYSEGAPGRKCVKKRGSRAPARLSQDEMSKAFTEFDKSN